jgi:hypothetical protein
MRANAPECAKPHHPQVILALMPTLAVNGAGPKGIAIAAKARALTAAGLDAPRVILIDLLTEYAREGLHRETKN